MELIKLLLTVLFGMFMLGSGFYHFSKPEIFLPFVPNGLPKEAVNYFAGVVELVAGILVFIPQSRHVGTLAILILMVVFLPIHVVDVFRQHPLIGTKQVAFQRLALQAIFILWAWFIHKK